jgi:hypothetical protein
MLPGYAIYDLFTVKVVWKLKKKAEIKMAD